MSILITCDCGQSFKAKDHLAGKRVKCPKCGQAIAIPQTAAGGTATSDSASEELSLEELMSMDASDGAAAAPPPDPDATVEHVPQAQVPGQQVPPDGGGFQSPSLFAQPGAAPAKKSRGGGENKSFLIAVCSLGGVALLAVIGIALSLLLSGDDPPSNSVAGNGTNVGPGKNPDPGGKTTPPVTKKKKQPAASNRVGYASPQKTLAAFIQAVKDQDLDKFKRFVDGLPGKSIADTEKRLKQAVKNGQLPSVDAGWRLGLRLAKISIDRIKREHPPKMFGPDRAGILIDIDNPRNSKLPVIQVAYFFTKKSDGLWYWSGEEIQGDGAKLLAALRKKMGLKEPKTSSASSLPLALNQWQSKPGRRRGLRRIQRDDPVHAGYSWMVELLPYMGRDALYKKFDFTKHYADGVGNRKAASTIIPEFLNPLDKRHKVTDLSYDLGLAVTHFVGMSGVEDKRNVVAAQLPRSDPRAGIFGYEEVASMRDITDGTSNTIMMIGVDMPRPWAQGGGSTIRGARRPLFGEVTGSMFATKGQRGTIVLMSDGSVRSVSPNVDPKIFEAACTIHGAESFDLKQFPVQSGFFK